MIDGIITKGIGGFYYVKTDEVIYECRARGKFRKEQITPLVGDKVKITIDSSTKQGVIEEIIKRDTEFIRPPVANVNQAIIVFAVKKPDPNLVLLDRFLVMAENEDVDVVVCFNKIDLDEKYLLELKKIYTCAGYPVVSTSVKNKIGIDTFKDILRDKITVFAGPSGVGKSSLLNETQPNLALKTGEISEKNKRGKHTTRHVELLELDFGGWVLDTPGFSSLNLDFIEEDQLQFLFREFVPYIGSCKFSGCKHLNEPKCAIKEAVLHNTINKSRYESYIQLLKEINQKRRY
ncbi:ribosome small subunit-dependent GTPase A [Crassaminicella thermophila]|uniref:Small ribosomal subunit biogenesis GTPase RsgA n=1 Tax=Crassaminicella thermophila TaxID=2599308 RepID=A0A5C0SCQ8_CRATE|nr:ribosome small subunit-dependent GTPase A [Crassaminicella thermophila]QEK12001.1 ribosome small subunit-dependent GTPase A [Crassaminicella thermophila]